MKLTNKQLEEVLQSALEIELSSDRMVEMPDNVYTSLDDFLIIFKCDYKYSKYDDKSFLKDVYEIQLVNSHLNPHELTPSQVDKIRLWILFHIKGLGYDPNGYQITV